ncbi:hypothetical protein AMTRI_Chr09g36910 [Amborella trichopoda]
MAAFWSGPLLLLGLLILQSPSWVVEGGAPPVFFFGDSILDVGNNNYLNTKAKCNMAPYGIDFPGRKPTGRFSNGLNIADFLAIQVGLKESPPAFLSLSGQNFQKRPFSGVNFASGGSGILDKTGSNFGQNLPLSVQISHFNKVYNDFRIRVGEAHARAALAESLIFISVGGNDKLYSIGARKFGILGLSKTGCIPVLRAQSKTGGCIEELNYVSQRFDNQVENMLRQLSSELRGMKYSLFVGTHLPEVGFAEMKTACCGLGKFNGEVACNPKASLCAKRNDYYYWDTFHPTQATSKMVVDIMYNGSPQYVVPINFKQLWRS